jgi:hypothetical protein
MRLVTAASRWRSSVRRSKFLRFAMRMNKNRTSIAGHKLSKFLKIIDEIRRRLNAGKITFGFANARTGSEPPSSSRRERNVLWNPDPPRLPVLLPVRKSRPGGDRAAYEGDEIAPPMRVMKSRRLICTPRPRTVCIVAAQSYTGKALTNVRFSNRPLGVKRFQTAHHYSVDVAHGLVLLFGSLSQGCSENPWNGAGKATLYQRRRMTSRPVRETFLFRTVAPLEKKPNCKTARVRHARISIVERADRRTAGHVLSKDGARRLAVTSPSCAKA